jgi:protein-tyrosine phosphatase
VINKVLFICIGNICRSPMAEGLLQQALPDKAVFSAGLSAMVGDPADPMAVQLMWELGVDISAHRGKSLAGWMVSEADLIVTMDRDQKRFIEHRYAGLKGKVMRLGECDKFDVPDPYQQGAAAFRHTCNLVARGIDDLVQRITCADRESNQALLSAVRVPSFPLAP